MTESALNLETGAQTLHESVLSAFHGEAALMRAMSWWVPVSTQFEEKLAASFLAWLHMQNANGLHRLMVELLRLPTPTVYEPSHAALVTRLCRAANLRSACAYLINEPPRHVGELLGSLAGLPRLFDFHYADVATQITRRYDQDIQRLRERLMAGTLERDGGLQWLV